MSKPKAKAKVKPATINFAPEVYDRVKSIADREERDFGSQIRFIVNQWLETQPKELRP